jgi:hypothetical protein
MTYIMRKLTIVCIALILFCACGTESKKTYFIKDAILTADGPLFDGPNTLQTNHIIDLSSLEPGLSPDQITGVKITKATISTDDSVGFDQIRNFVLQLTAADAKMEKIAVLNPVQKGLKTVDLSVSSEGELKDNFTQKEIILILDADLIGDKEDNLSYKGSFEFEITYKK